MEINKAKNTKLSVQMQSLNLGKQGLKSVNKNLNTLNTTRNDDKEDLNDSDVNKMLTPVQQKAWKKLSTRKQNQMIIKAKKSIGMKMASMMGKAGLRAGVSTTAATSTGGLSLLVEGSAKVTRGFIKTLQNSVNSKGNTITQNLQHQINNQVSEASNIKTGVALAVFQLAVVMVQLLSTILTTLLMILIPFIITVAIISLIVSIISAVAQLETLGSSGATLVEVAKYELEVQDGIYGGEKYKTWYGIDGNWCAMFVSYCADQSGFIDEGIIPLTASVSVQQQWFIDNDLYETKESGYKPKAGDIIIFKETTSHTGIVISYDSDTDRVTTIEGNTGSSGTSPYHLGSQVKESTYSRLASTISGYGTPDYPEGSTGAGPLATSEGSVTVLPGSLGSSYSFMGWQTITSTTSAQFQLRKESGMNFDAEGFGVIGDRYVIACTTTFGVVGDYIDFYLEDGSIIKTIVGDIKNQSDPGCNIWGHNDGANVLEFIVDQVSWYGTGHANPGTTSCHPEWNQYITKAINRGNYWRE